MASIWEPGLLTVLRAFVAARLGLAFVLLLPRIALQPVGNQALSTMVRTDAVGVALLAVVAFGPTLERRLGRAYLPVLIFLATLGPLIAQRAALASPDWPAAPTPLAQGWHLIPLLLVPLVAVAAQYQIRSVVAYCAATAALDLALLATAVGQHEAARGPLFAILVVRTLAFGVVGLLVVMLMRRQRAQRAALAEANRRLAHYASVVDQLATSRERNRLAREMHDTVAHALSGVAVQLEAARTLRATDPTTAHAMLDGALATTRAGLIDVRGALQALRAEPLDDLGLALAIGAEAQTAAARAGLALSLDLADRLPLLPETVSHTFYRVAQEALENVVRHAEASRLTVALSQTADGLRLTVADDGRGFDPAASPPARYGLLGMRERCAAIGAELTLDTRPDKGTVIHLLWRGEA